MTDKLPTLFVPHGGGPCFFMEWNPPDAWNRMGDWLRGVSGLIGARPKAVLVVSGHWEEPSFTVNAQAAPPLLYDYNGFPEHTYRLTYPAPGSPALAAQVRELLSKAGSPTAEDHRRGLDHGVFIPFKLIYPDADIPVVQLSLRTGLDPAEHIAMGRALEPLREQGVLIVGSGMSFHNMRRFRWDGSSLDPDSVRFDSWLAETVEAEPAERERRLTAWADAPSGRVSHPREEHLLPLHVVAGAAGGDLGHRVFEDRVLGSAQSAFLFGKAA
ncbi:DODA-type extradiol aromatic ring-opening family dioxygenase [Indioceanicola profundi]|uniref:DODA-type extradiol aromatic ring-opening family dioxygenase n=1 Tax=Indioceanicola profundi TaxID=2220096 RepID=UPI0013C4738A|nr:class III extradiol ring-cleavage dioxygenase [Indioceanicola profundi]